MDRLTIKRPSSSRPDPYAQVELLINGVPLLDLVRQCETPHVTKEITRRAAEGELPDELASLVAGAYMYPTSSMMSEADPGTFFGLVDASFVLEPGDPRSGSTMILGCDCGNPECWPLVAQITVTPSTVVWSKIGQFHRDWSLGLGPFTFDRAQYERELLGSAL